MKTRPNDDQEVLLSHRLTIQSQRQEITTLRKENAALRAEHRTHIDHTKELKQALKTRKDAEKVKAECIAEARQKEDEICRLWQRVRDVEEQLRRCGGQVKVSMMSEPCYWKKGTGLVIGEYGDSESSESQWGDGSDWPTEVEPPRALPNFMKGTCSTRAKQAGRAKQAVPETWPVTPPLTPSTEMDEGESELSDDDDLSDLCQPGQTRLQELYPSFPNNDWRYILRTSQHGDMTKGQMEQVDAGWLQGYAGAVTLPSKFAKAILNKALDMAAEIWYIWGQINTPNLMARQAPEGWWDLTLDRTTLIELGCGRGNEWRDRQSPYSILFEDLADLRNECCHFSRSKSSSPKHLFWLIHPVLEFANKLEDKTCARRAKMILQELHEEAIETYDFIDRTWLLSVLPRAHPWAYHHRIMFGEARASLKEYFRRETNPDPRLDRPIKTFGPAVLRAAWSREDARSQSRNRDGRIAKFDRTSDIDKNDLARKIGYLYYNWSPKKDSTNWLLRSARLRRRVSVSGSDCESMARAGWAKARWKDRTDLRVNLGWLDVSLPF